MIITMNYTFSGTDRLYEIHTEKLSRKSLMIKLYYKHRIKLLKVR